MPRGGRRSGAPGKAYGERTDLNMNKGPTPNVPYGMGGGMGYGESKALSDSQQAVPVSSPAPPSPMGAPDLASLLGGAGTPPGGFGDLLRGTERPLEPITHGLPTGPGGGPEVMQTGQTNAARSLLQQMARSPYASSDIQDLLNLM